MKLKFTLEIEADTDFRAMSFIIDKASAQLTCAADDIHGSSWNWTAMNVFHNGVRVGAWKIERVRRPKAK